MPRSQAALFLITVVLVAGCGRLDYQRASDAAVPPSDAAVEIDGGDAGGDGGSADGGSADAGTGDGGPADAGSPMARPLTPWSTGMASRARPTFRFALGGGADAGRVEVCLEPACTTFVTTFDGPSGTTMPVDLPRTGSGIFFWRVTPLVAGAVAGPPSATWILLGRSPPSATAVDTTLLSQMDLDGDGLAEMAVGSATGEVRVLAGSASGPSTTRTWTIAGSSGHGASLASAGDVDGDGRAELLIGSPSAATAELARVDGAGAIALVTLSGASGSRFGASVAGLGDVNGDGYSDVAIGAPGEARVHVFYGSPSGVPSSTSAVLAGSGAFGHAVTGGDFDGDGFGDLAVASPDLDRVDVFHGGASGIEASARLTLTGTAGTGFGQSIAGHGDGTYDGRSDLLVGAPIGAGVVHVFASTASGLEATPRNTIDETVPMFGAVVTFVMDLDLQGYDDAVASDAQGSVWTYFAQPRGIGTVSGWSPQISVPPGALGFGAALGGTGDTDGDRYGEAAMGAPGSDRAYIYLGGGGGLGRETIVMGTAGSGMGASIAQP